MNTDTESPIERTPNDDRLAAFPIERTDIWDFYVRARKCFWGPTEIDLSSDRLDFMYSDKMNDNIRRFIEYILAFFSSMDRLVNINLASRFKNDIQIFEVDCFYDFQMAMENIHNEVYSLQLETIIEDPERRAKLLRSIETMPIIRKMTDWVVDCTKSDAPFGERLIRMACVEGIFFMGAFTAIYWLQSQGIMKGLAQANELIHRDESLHTEFALYLFTLIKPKFKIDAERVQSIVRDAVNIAKEFIIEALPTGLAGINARIMSDYIERIANDKLVMIGIEPIYEYHPMPYFMEMINLPHRTNFFEKRVTEYAKLSVADKTEFELDDSF